MKARHLYLLAAAILALIAVWLATLTPGIKANARPSGASAVPASPSAAAELTGIVKLLGPAPHRATINMVTDSSCARLHPTPATTEEVITGQNGELKNAVVFISGGLENHTFGPPADPVSIEQKGCVYGPHVLGLQAGQTFQVVNTDATIHNIHPLPRNNREWNRSQPPGSPPLQQTFGREEIAIPVKCDVHPWMRAYIAVFKHPYFDVTGADGKFDIKSLPPGSYTISAWHEKFGVSTERVTVGPNESKVVQFVFKAQ
jgi:plastocyanin